MTVYTIREVDDMFKLDPNLVADLLIDDKLKFIKICDQVRITEDQIKIFLKRKEIKSL